jgi:murein L,D-transpeptidase YafK
MQMKKVIKLWLLICWAFTLTAQTGQFKAAQLKNARVKKAYNTKWKGLQAQLKAMDVDASNFDLFVRVFKYEKQLELWVKNKGAAKYKKLKTIAVCASSGDLGPKRKEGDNQVPEGFYQISAFNPSSNYHLSLKVNYPNASDQALGKSPLGGDIMIHGNCVTIGCIPIENDPIEEVYVLCVEAKNNKGILYVDIYPCQFTPENTAYLAKNYGKDKLSFWNRLKDAYLFFEEHKWLPKVNIDKKGNYKFEE